MEINESMRLQNNIALYVRDEVDINLLSSLSDFFKNIEFYIQKQHQQIWETMKVTLKERRPSEID